MQQHSNENDKHNHEVKPENARNYDTLSPGPSVEINGQNGTIDDITSTTQMA